MEIDIARITIGERRRKDMGNIESLAASIRDIGLLHPPVVTADFRLVVGERRLRAYQSMGRKTIPVRMVDNLDQAMRMMLAERDENICRKDFALTEAVAMGKALEAIERPKAKERQGRPGKLRSEKFSEQAEGRLLDKVGEAVGLSRITYARAAAVVDAAEADPSLKPLLDEMDKKGKVNGTYEKMKQAQAESHRSKVVAKIKRLHSDIRVGDFRTSLADLPDESVDLIFTDPPYDKASIPLYGELATLGARVLKDGGSLVCYASQNALPAIFPLMTKLRHQWTITVRHSGGQVRMHGYRVRVACKPMLWFLKGKYKGEYLLDLLDSEPGNKMTHEWAQGHAEAAYLIEQLCPVGGLVLDPMCGSGTTLAAAHRLGRKFLGVEIDRDRAKMATKTLHELEHGPTTTNQEGAK